MTKEVVGDFEGNLNVQVPKEMTFFDRLFNLAVPSTGLEEERHDPLADRRHISAINTRDAKMHHLFAKVSNTRGNHKAQLDLSSEITRRMRVDHVFEQFGKINDDPDIASKDVFPLPTNFDCLKKMMNAYDTECQKMEDYDLSYVKYLVRECETLSSPDAIADVIKRLKIACQH